MKVIKFISSSFVIVFAYFILVKDSVWLYPYLHVSIGIMFLLACIEQIRLKHKGKAIGYAVLSLVFFIIAFLRLTL